MLGIGIIEVLMNLLSLSLGFANQAVSTLTATCACTTKFYRYTPHLLPTGIWSRQQGGGGGEQSQNIQVSRGVGGSGQATYREGRCPGISPSRENPPNERPRTRRCQDLEENSRRSRRGHRGVERPATGKTPRIQQIPGLRQERVQMREELGGERIRKGRR